MSRAVVALAVGAVLITSAAYRVRLSAQVGSREPNTLRVGDERSIVQHMPDGAEFTTDVRALLEHGRRLFAANWTSEDGGGRPSTKGTGRPLAAASEPLVGSRAANRISA